MKNRVVVILIVVAVAMFAVAGPAVARENLEEIDLGAFLAHAELTPGTFFEDDADAETLVLVLFDPTESKLLALFVSEPVLPDPFETYMASASTTAPGDYDAKLVGEQPPVVGAMFGDPNAPQPSHAVIDGEVSIEVELVDEAGYTLVVGLDLVLAPVDGDPFEDPEGAIGAEVSHRIVLDYEGELMLEDYR